VEQPKHGSPPAREEIVWRSLRPWPVTRTLEGSTTHRWGFRPSRLMVR